MLCISQLGIYRVKIISVFLIQQLFLTNSLIFITRIYFKNMMSQDGFWMVLVLDIAFRLSLDRQYALIFILQQAMCFYVKYYVRITAEVSQILVS